MPRGGLLREATVSDVPSPTVNIPPARRRLDASSTEEHVGQRKTGFLTFLVATLVGAGLLALIGWQAAPYLLQTNKTPQQTADTPPAPKAPAKPTPTAVTAPPPVVGTVADAKPSPMSPAPPAPESTTTPVDPPKKAEKTEDPKPRPKQPPAAPSPVEVTIITSPGGATAIMDGHSDTSCKTPCAIEATPGHHTVALSLAGYEIERRDIDVGTSPFEMSAVVLRTSGGTLMLSSAPAGAAVSVDGKKTSYVTPISIPLSVGPHKVTVEKDGRTVTQTVEIGQTISVLKITLER